MSTSLISTSLRAANQQPTDGRDLHTHCRAIFDGTLALTTVRRQAARRHLLASYGRESIPPLAADAQASDHAGWASALESLRSLTRLVPDWLLRSIDEVLVEQADPNSDISRGVQQLGISLGFNTQEVAWLRSDAERFDFRVVAALTANGRVSLRDVLDGALSGEHDLLHCGFLGFTGKAAVDAAITTIVQTWRERGATASLFHLLPVISHVSRLTAEGPQDRSLHPIVMSAFAA